MPELRRGPTSDRWVIVAPERAKRPSDFERRGSDPADPIDGPQTCPFCAGNEAMTPPELYRDPAPDGWYVRVVPNKFAALQGKGDAEREEIDGLYTRMSGVGAHEVVIDSPDHTRAIPDLPVEQGRRILDAYVARLTALSENPSVRHVLLFKNHGPDAGASLLHPHSQIVAIPVVPREVRDALRIAKRYYDRERRCVYCDLLRAEIRAEERIVESDDGYVVWAPYDSRFPFELAVCPTRHSHDFAMLDGSGRMALARVLQRTLKRLTLLLGDVPYNLVLETAPNPVPRRDRPDAWRTLPDDYHWRIAILPRLTRIAGFEWGTGVYINPMPPEQAAGYLRDVDLPA